VLRLYDTARQEVAPFEAGPVVRMYTCGVTPYDSTHVGHASTALVYDVLSRRLLDLGHEVRCVRNVTDVDDPLLAKARELGVHYLDLAAAETARYQRDLAALNVLPVASEPRATGAIPDIRGFIGALLDGGHGYAADGSVYFDISTFDRWGQVSHYDEATMLAFAAERGGNPDDPNKRHPLDFVLWQPSAEGEPAWDSLWGPGRPGWHVECSTLAMRDLGPTIDVHGGGSDLIFPHHECEAAQSESVTGKTFARHWVHAPMVHLDGTKMSKSLGNLVFVSDLLERVDPAVVRLAVLDHHYRQDWDWTDGLLDGAAERLDRWRGADREGDGGAALEGVRSSLDRDLDTPAALAAVDDAAGSGRDVTEAAALLGVEI
jgi:L-cysteine:1D-myo-inositol 2-amino-2-deoxy-alpha-D-glucopyranoside ligase